jgi:hypothetical protein
MNLVSPFQKKRRLILTKYLYTHIQYEEKNKDRPSNVVFPGMVHEVQ